MRVLESERLLLKPVEENDLDYLLDLRWNAEVVESIIHDPLSFTNQKEWFKNLKKTDLPLSIFLKKDNQLQIIGTVGFYNIEMRHQRATWRLRVDPLLQGKGIGSEAAKMLFDYGFKTLNLIKITGDAFADNQAILKLHEKIGFKQEGFLSKHYYHKGEFRDSIQLALFKEDFYNSQKKTT